MSGDPARRRWLLIRAVELLATAGAVFGLVLAGRADGTPDRLLGAAITLSALLVAATAPRALARRWRSLGP